MSINLDKTVKQAKLLMTLEQTQPKSEHVSAIEITPPVSQAIVNLQEQLQSLLKLLLSADLLCAILVIKQDMFNVTVHRIVFHRHQSWAIINETLAHVFYVGPWGTLLVFVTCHNSKETMEGCVCEATRIHSQNSKPYPHNCSSC